MGRGQSVRQAVGVDEERRVRNVSYVNNQLARMNADGAVRGFEHRVEERRTGDGTIDLWELLLDGDQHPWSYTYQAVRALIRGYQLGLGTR